ncbi:MAG: NGG1p interacting factor NIF3 [Candidatus Buchananbacteria bacterium]
MNTKKIYELIVLAGIQADLRGSKRVKQHLNRLNEKYKKLSTKEKMEFDKESLSNPYTDSRILNTNGREIKRIMAGIDIDGSELLLAKHIGGVDLVVAHHPQGLALAGLHEVMLMQAEILADYGIPINIAQSLIKLRISEVSRSLSPANHSRSVDFAKILGLDFMCVHTPADNLAASFLVKLYEKKKNSLETVEDLIDLLKTIPEYSNAVKIKNGPKIFVGLPENYLGKVVFTEITGGTSGSKDIYEKMSHYGIGTIVGMHMSDEHRQEAEKYHINVVIAGHMSSDSLGMNLFLDKIEKRGVEIIPVSGFIRVKRF